MPAPKWIWNYFTLENICNAKCRLCDNCVRPTITTLALLHNHITTNKTDHDAVINEEHKYLKTVPWDTYYNTLHSTDNLLDPEAECVRCGHLISSADSEEIRKKTFLHASSEMKLHLKKVHEVDENNWIVLSNLVRDSKAYYDITKSGTIQLYKCKICIDKESRPINAIMFAKHMIDKHCEKFSRDKVPKELLPLYDSMVREDTTLSSDITDRPGSSRQGGSEVSSESTQFSRKCKNDTQIEEPPNKRIPSNVELIKKYNDEIFNLICKRNIIIQKLMSTSKKAIFTLTQKIEKILEEMLEGDNLEDDS